MNLKQRSEPDVVASNIYLWRSAIFAAISRFENSMEQAAVPVVYLSGVKRFSDSEMIFV